MTMPSPKQELNYVGITPKRFEMEKMNTLWLCFIPGPRPELVFFGKKGKNEIAIT